MTFGAYLVRYYLVSECMDERKIGFPAGQADFHHVDAKTESWGIMFAISVYHRDEGIVMGDIVCKRWVNTRRSL